MPLPDILINNGQSVVHFSSCSYSVPYCHTHNHNELLFLVSGRLRLENNLDVTEISAPAVVIHNSYTLHRAELLEGEYERYIVNFDDATLDEIEGMRETVRFFKNANMTVIRLTEEMRETLEKYFCHYPHTSNSDGSQNALTCLILYEIAKYRSDDNTVRLRAKIPYINDVMSYISSRYSEPLTLDELAAHFYVSRAKLAADFSGATNMTVKQYSTLVRMNVARGMILEGSSVSEAAHACGYSNVSNFAAAFSKIFGENPAKFKK